MVECSLILNYHLDLENADSGSSGDGGGMKAMVGLLVVARGVEVMMLVVLKWW